MADGERREPLIRRAAGVVGGAVAGVHAYNAVSGIAGLSDQYLDGPWGGVARLFSRAIGVSVAVLTGSAARQLIIRTLRRIEDRRLAKVILNKMEQAAVEDGAVTESAYEEGVSLTSTVGNVAVSGYTYLKALEYFKRFGGPASLRAIAGAASVSVLSGYAAAALIVLVLIHLPRALRARTLRQARSEFVSDAAVVTTESKKLLRIDRLILTERKALFLKGGTGVQTSRRRRNFRVAV